MSGQKTEVGGLPIFFCASYTDPGNASVTITTPSGFYPDYVVVCPNTTNGARAEWVLGGNANPGGILQNATTGTRSLMTANGIYVAAGTIRIGTDVVDDDITGTVCAWRYTA